MKQPPREIEVHIEELVLYGFPNASRHHLADVLQNELQVLIAQGGVPPAWLSSPGLINGGKVPAPHCTSPETAGQAIASAVHGGGPE